MPTARPSTSTYSTDSAPPTCSTIARPLPVRGHLDLPAVDAGGVLVGDVRRRTGERHLDVGVLRPVADVLHGPAAGHLEGRLRADGAARALEQRERPRAVERQHLGLLAEEGRHGQPVERHRLRTGPGAHREPVGGGAGMRHGATVSTTDVRPATPGGGPTAVTVRLRSRSRGSRRCAPGSPRPRGVRQACPGGAGRRSPPPGPGGPGRTRRAGRPGLRACAVHPCPVFVTDREHGCVGAPRLRSYRHGFAGTRSGSARPKSSERRRPPRRTRRSPP